jgi:hypothetical protein
MDYPLGLLTLFIIGTHISTYFYKLKAKFGDTYAVNDPLNRLYGKITLNLGSYERHICIGYWSITHFTVHHSCASVMGPSIIPFSLFAGIAWEVMEDLISQATKKKSFGKKHGRRWEGKDEVQYLDWWTGTVDDIVWNMLGAMTGVSFHQLFSSTIINIWLSLIGVVYFSHARYTNDHIDGSVVMTLCEISGMAMLIHTIGALGWLSVMAYLLSYFRCLNLGTLWKACNFVQTTLLDIRKSNEEAVLFWSTKSSIVPDHEPKGAHSSLLSHSGSKPPSSSFRMYK